MSFTQLKTASSAILSPWPGFNVSQTKYPHFFQSFIINVQGDDAYLDTSVRQLIVQLVQRGLIHTCETLGKILCFSKIQFSHLYNGFISGNTMYLHSMPDLVRHNGRVISDYVFPPEISMVVLIGDAVYILQRMQQLIHLG